MRIPEHIAGIVPYPPGKPIEELEREYGITGSIKLASNENPWGPSPAALRAVTATLATLHRYPDGGWHHLGRALALRHGVGPENIVLGNGSNEIIDFLVRVFVEKGDTVVTSHPTFLMYEKTVQARGGRVRAVPLSDMRHDLAAIARAITPDTRLLFLDVPNNPCGSIVSPADFLAFLRLLPADLVVVVDEAYVDFVPAEMRLPVLSLMEGPPPVVALRTFSKAYGLAGLRVGYGIMSPAIASCLNRVRQPFNVNSLAQAGALAALDDEEHYNHTVRQTAAEMAWLGRGLRDRGFTVFPSYTNFFLFDLGRDAKEVYELLLRRGVIVRPMGAYGFPDYLRITVGRREENERFLDALRDVFAQFA